MSSPQFGPIDDDTADLLSLLSEDPRKDDLFSRFLRACQTEDELEGYVSVNRVRRRLSNEHGLVIEPRLYSSFWARACGKGGPMVTTTEWETSDDKRGGNSGKPQRKRRWVG